MERPLSSGKGPPGWGGSFLRQKGRTTLRRRTGPDASTTSHTVLRGCQRGRSAASYPEILCLTWKGPLAAWPAPSPPPRAQPRRIPSALGHRPPPPCPPGGRDRAPGGCTADGAVAALGPPARSPPPADRRDGGVAPRRLPVDGGSGVRLPPAGGADGDCRSW